MTYNNPPTIYKATQIITIEGSMKIYSPTNENTFLYNLDSGANKSSLEYNKVDRISTHPISSEFTSILQNYIEHKNIASFF